MRVLVTGGAGKLGQVTSRWLLQQGWDVRIFDQVPTFELAGAEYVCGDITQYAAVREAIKGCEAVVHLAALPAPFMAEGQELFRINVAGTYTVYEAAAKAGVKRIAQASSINAMGCAWNLGDVVPQYFPIDEKHPLSTNDPYSFSKQMVEEIGAYYWRREGLASVSLRFPWIYPEGHLQSEQFSKRRAVNIQLMEELRAMDEMARLARLSDVRRRALEFRAERPLEEPDAFRRRPYPDDLLWNVYTFDRFNFWTFVDVRDAARSLEMGLLADYEGHHPLFINDTHNWLDTDSRTLIRLFFPDVQPIHESLAGSLALVSTAQARAVIGFEPAFPVTSLEHKS